MKNVGRIIFIVVVAILLMGSSVQAQTQTNSSQAAQQVVVDAEILETITINNDNVVDMDFGAGTAPDTGTGQVTLDVNAAGALSIDYTGFWEETGVLAAVEITGRADRSYLVSIENVEVDYNVATAVGAPQVVLATDTQGSLIVDQFTIISDNGSFEFSGGPDTLNIGAVLNVPANFTADSYTGDFEVTVSYE